MCGIFGFIDYNEAITKEFNQHILNSMGDFLYHRGPDGYSCWINEEGNVNFGHRRLSIIDLSNYGLQPMQSNCGRYVIIFNGEIYNFEEIRKEILTIKKFSFKGHSDTEVILAAVQTWGLEPALKKMYGMFAIALYDKQQQTIHLIRDRMGEKPLYYGWSGNQFIFGSELKIFKQHPSYEGEIDRDVLSLYLKYNYVPAPYSIYKNVYKLLPGTMITLNIKSKEIVEKKYWEIEKTSKYTYSDENSVVNDLNKLLITSIERQMSSSDVPVGAFLSGGVDSSTVSAIMQSLSSRPVNTFSIGFYEDGYDEAKYAKDVAKYLKTNHTELYLTAQQAIDIIPKLPNIYDEPFADSSQIPTYLVSQLAKQHVTVTLSGDGGDELFGGYKRYAVMDNLTSKIDKIPNFIKRSAMGSIKTIEKSSISSLLNNKYPKQTDYLYRIAEMLEIKSNKNIYNYFMSSIKNPNLVVNDSERLPTFYESEKSEEFLYENGFMEWMMYMDMHMYLPDDILTKVDRASMANSIESRVPLLDPDIVEYAMSLPLKYKIKGNTQKWILKEVMYRHLPKALMDRPKKGFGIPLDLWLRGPLVEWAENLLNEKKMSEQGYFNVERVREKWLQHRSGKRNWSSQLWGILMFQAWLEEQ